MVLLLSSSSGTRRFLLAFFLLKTLSVPVAIVKICMCEVTLDRWKSHPRKSQFFFWGCFVALTFSCFPNLFCAANNQTRRKGKMKLSLATLIIALGAFSNVLATCNSNGRRLRSPEGAVESLLVSCRCSCLIFRVVATVCEVRIPTLTSYRWYISTFFIAFFNCSAEHQRGHQSKHTCMLWIFQALKEDWKRTRTRRIGFSSPRKRRTRNPKKSPKSRPRNPSSLLWLLPPCQLQRRPCPRRHRRLLRFHRPRLRRARQAISQLWRLAIRHPHSLVQRRVKNPLRHRRFLRAQARRLQSSLQHSRHLHQLPNPPRPRNRQRSRKPFVVQLPRLPTRVRRSSIGKKGNKGGCEIHVRKNVAHNGPWYLHANARDNVVK
jgi:hypothetical protein